MKWTEADVLARLERRYPGGQYAFFPQVRNGTGFTANRTADAIALGLWPSRGLRLHGFEIKVARYDWLRELKHPEKADEMFAYFDHWWIVVPELDEPIIQNGELPPTWGQLVVTSKVIKVVKEAPPLTPQPLDRLFVAAMLRKAAALNGPMAKIRAAREEGYARGLEEGKNEVINQDGTARELADLRKEIQTFEEASGIQIGEWRLGRIGAAARIIAHLPVDTLKSQLLHTRGAYERLLAEHDKAMSELDKLPDVCAKKEETAA